MSATGRQVDVRAHWHLGLLLGRYRLVRSWVAARSVRQVANWVGKPTFAIVLGLLSAALAGVYGITASATFRPILLRCSDFGPHQLL